MILFRLLIFLAAFVPLTFNAATDDGRGIDPNGGLTSSSSCGDEGNGLDPHGGRCPGTVLSDAGPRIDPEG
jgi:hypothetical protein